MPITASKIANNSAQVTLRYGEDTVNITYYPGRFTERTYAQLQAFDAASSGQMVEGLGSLNDVLAHLIKDWDVLEDDGVTMFPLSVDRLSELPIVFRVQVLGAVMRDIRPETLAPQQTLSS
jgi:hypothetical protein